MDHQNKIFRGAETRQCKMVFPGTLNANETLFGGEMMKWMDEAAFICSTRATRQKMFTAKVENVEFLCPVKENSIVEIVARVKNAGPVKLEIVVEAWMESLYDSGRKLACRADFIMTALNEKNKVTRLAVPDFVESSVSG
ncbi:acyl-CoA thioesterase [Marinilabilia rubra]|uniref:Acyl-CoA thioesterase n=1 Tax=Marinilabilia rubra TaxID=2162893 RepID=A0A2U2B700_9BACT|nr:hotdog domain-containing protein [Marinilabilia rubra]PWD98837.1 acyl-CoA thioesterase [Marinilabilia rubra]